MLRLTDVVDVPLVAQLNQAGRTVNGTWESTQDVWQEPVRGTLTGEVSQDGFSGTLTIFAPDPVEFVRPCEESTPVKGPARTGDSTLAWTTAAWTKCRGLVGYRSTLTLHR